jgi:hypothetical protein
LLEAASLSARSEWRHSGVVAKGDLDADAALAFVVGRRRRVR